MNLLFFLEKWKRNRRKASQLHACNFSFNWFYAHILCFFFSTKLRRKKKSLVYILYYHFTGLTINMTVLIDFLFLFFL